MKKIILMISAGVMICSSVAAQSKKAGRLFDEWDYYQAAKLYEKEIEKHPTPELYYLVGECYERSNLFDQAVTNYDKVNQAGPYKDPEFYLHYGLMLKSAERYAEAKEAFKKYDKLRPEDKKGKFFMNSCDIAVSDRKYDEPVKVTNVESVNSPEYDFGAVMYKEGMVFASSRHMEGHDKVYGRTGGFYLDILYVKNGGTCTDFSMAIPLRSCTGFSEPAPLQGNDINQGYHDGPVSFSKNLDTVFITRVKKNLERQERVDAGIERNKIFSSRLVNGKWTELEAFPLNSDSFSVSLPFLSGDGQRLYFASDMPGGYGSSDIYYCSRQGNTWGKPVNMGPGVNTFGSEKFPYVDEEGNLYFSSNGYAGFGGFDICVAQNMNGRLLTALPLKCPINSSYDDYGLISLQNGKTGYFSSNRKGGLGKEDIYYFDLGMYSDILTKIYTIGYRPKPADTAFMVISITDSKTGQLVSKGNFNSMRGKAMKMYETAYTNGTVRFSIAERSLITMRTSSDGYNTHYDTLSIPALKNDTTLAYTIVLSKPEKIITMRSGSKPALFDFGKATLRKDAMLILDSVAAYMKKNSAMHVDICAHTDSRGTEAYNIRLSRLRALAASDYLRSKGISSNRIAREANGYSQLLNGCTKLVVCTDAQHQANRRVEFKFNGSPAEGTSHAMNK